MTSGPRGTYAEVTPVKASLLLPVPDGLSLDVATSAAVQGLTAHYLVTGTHAPGHLPRGRDWRSAGGPFVQLRGPVHAAGDRLPQAAVG